jgi:hypothetical protein
MGEGDFLEQEPIPRRGISFLTVDLLFPRGGRRFSGAGTDPPAGNSFLTVDLPFSRGGRRAPQSSSLSATAEACSAAPTPR